MAKTLKLPEGRVSKVIQGGPSSLKKLIPLLRERAFTGYLKFVSDDRDETGYMVMRDGKQAQAYYRGRRGTLMGKAALPPLRELSRAPETLLEVHLTPNADEVDGPPEGSQSPLVRGFSALRRRLDGLRAHGEAEGGPALDVGSLLEVEAEPRRGRPPSVAEAGLRDLSHLSAREGGPIRERAETVRPPPDAGRRASPSVDAASGLHPEYTFENLLVGDYNRFAHAAGLAIAEGSVEPYSPLFIVGSPGLGKTHLLHAVGNRMREGLPSAKLLYLTASRYWSELQRADRDGRTAEFRDRFFGLDLFLLDDIQDVEGRDRVQEELFELFEEFRRQGRPLVMVADRYPSAIVKVDARLVSRLESGLVADLKVPDAGTRLEYLKLLVRRREADCPHTVLKFLAERYTVDMRELEGALNKVLAYGASLGRRIDLPLAQEALGEVDAASALQPLERRPDLRPGHSYLLEEERGNRSFQLFAQKGRSVRGLLISRTNPTRLRERYGMDGVDLLWLTDRSDSEERTVEPVLERLLHRVESFMIAGGQGIVMLDGLEFLKSANSFEAVLKFLRRVVDGVAESEFTFVLALNPGTLDGKELRILEREMEPIDLDEPPSGKPSA